MPEWWYDGGMLVIRGWFSHDHTPPLPPPSTPRTLLPPFVQVYDSVSITRICELIPFSTPQQVELVLIDASRNFDLQARVDHRSGAVSFGQDLSGSHRMEFPADDSPVYQVFDRQATGFSPSLPFLPSFPFLPLLPFLPSPFIRYMIGA